VGKNGILRVDLWEDEIQKISKENRLEKMKR
jgi:hypothetical protein